VLALFLAPAGFATWANNLGRGDYLWGLYVKRR